MTPDQQIQNAVNQLARSAVGLQALQVLGGWLDADGNLDGANQNAVLMLLEAAWGGHTGTIRQLIREAIQA